MVNYYCSLFKLLIYNTTTKNNLESNKKINHCQNQQLKLHVVCCHFTYIFIALTSLHNYAYFAKCLLNFFYYILIKCLYSYLYFGSLFKDVFISFLFLLRKVCIQSFVKLLLNQTFNSVFVATQLVSFSGKFDISSFCSSKLVPNQFETETGLNICLSNVVVWIEQFYQLNSGIKLLPLFTKRHQNFLKLVNRYRF